MQCDVRPLCSTVCVLDVACQPQYCKVFVASLISTLRPTKQCNVPPQGMLDGACTHCHYANLGSRCSFKVKAIEDKKKKKELEEDVWPPWTEDNKDEMMEDMTLSELEEMEEVLVEDKKRRKAAKSSPLKRKRDM